MAIGCALLRKARVTTEREGQERDLEEFSERPEQVETTLVAVLPDCATPWQVRILGSLGIATGVFLVYEQAWRNDFNAMPAAPFSVEPASSRGATSNGGSDSAHRAAPTVATGVAEGAAMSLMAGLQESVEVD